VPAVVLGDHNVGQAKAASVAHEHVQPPGNRFVGDDDTVWMEVFGGLRGLRTRCSAQVEHQPVRICIQQANGQHACRFLPCNAPRFVKQSHHSTGISRCFSTVERHAERRLFGHPRQGLRPESLDLGHGPFSVGSVQADAEGFRQRLEGRFKPSIDVAAEVAYERRER
jgi:hypothetical protein